MSEFAAETRAVDSACWQALRRHAERLGSVPLRALLAEGDVRVERLHCAAGPWHADFSKQRIDESSLAALLALARAAGIEGRRDQLFAGERVNVTEDRAALHVALRGSADPGIQVEGVDVADDIAGSFAKLGEFVEAVRAGRITGYSGRPLRHIVNLGIGGSDLGPRMAVRALRAHSLPELRLHFVANLDGADLASTLAHCPAAETLVIVASKTFTTQETLANARSVRAWLEQAVTAAGLPAGVATNQFASVTANLDRAREFGIPDACIFPFRDWVGGRYSLWSSVGLPLALAIGMNGFAQLLAGAAAIDHHFRSAPLEANLPVWLALIDIWNLDFLGAESHAMLPYSDSLALLPAYLQQLEMESNGKSVRADGTPVGCPTAPVIWGEAGTVGQHSFYQLLHQGGRLIPCDFIAFAEADFDLPGHHDALLAHCLAQSAALALGKTLAEATSELSAAGHDPATVARLAPHKVFPGNQPSTTLIAHRLTAESLGALIALHEHKVFVQAAIWGLNPFDQWGVEYGKVLAARLLPQVAAGRTDPIEDASTRAAIAIIAALRARRRS
ncbi:MAG: Glucose-6-phosphate isomerase [Rhodocyclaceae bacterium]|nr:glucose-6-phosphate isomerase [Rhodocyclaceae bacterium]MCG3187870.1 Glucose-6-phosphate isomerase [Rhodocyclaceae bacterium]